MGESNLVRYFDKRDEVPASPRQRRYLNILGRKLKIKEDIGDLPMTIGAAGEWIRELENECLAKGIPIRISRKSRKR